MHEPPAPTPPALRGRYSFMRERPAHPLRAKSIGPQKERLGVTHGLQDPDGKRLSEMIVNGTRPIPGQLRAGHLRLPSAYLRHDSTCQQIAHLQRSPALPLLSARATHAPGLVLANDRCRDNDLPHDTDNGSRHLYTLHRGTRTPQTNLPQGTRAVAWTSGAARALHRSMIDETADEALMNNPRERTQCGDFDRRNSRHQSYITRLRSGVLMKIDRAQ